MNIFYALSTATRRDLLALLLKESELSLIELSYRLRANVAVVNYDLDVLLDAQLISAHAVGATDLEYTYRLRYKEHIRNVLEAERAISVKNYS